MKKTVAVLFSLGIPALGLVAYQLSDRDSIITRRYDITGILVSGGEGEEQLDLFESYQLAIQSNTKQSMNADLMIPTFEGVGIAFPDGTWAMLSPADTHIYIRHHTSILDEIEQRFSIEGQLYRHRSRWAQFVDDALDFIGLGDDDPFAHTLDKSGQNKASISTPDPRRVESAMTIQPSTQRSEPSPGQV